MTKLVVNQRRSMAFGDLLPGTQFCINRGGPRWLKISGPNNCARMQDGEVGSLLRDDRVYPITVESEHPPIPLLQMEFGVLFRFETFADGFWIMVRPGRDAPSCVRITDGATRSPDPDTRAVPLRATLEIE